jgi:hypothetical protein
MTIRGIHHAVVFFVQIVDSVCVVLDNGDLKIKNCKINSFVKCLNYFKKQTINSVILLESNLACVPPILSKTRSKTVLLNGSIRYANS